MSESLRPRVECAVCHVRRRVEASHTLCDHCAKDAGEMQKIAELIFRKFPKMAVHTTPELFIRLWLAFEPVKQDPVAYRAAEALQAEISGSIISEAPKPENPEAHEEFRRNRRRRRPPSRGP